MRYPDYYGIDMPHLEELAAFRAAISLLELQGRTKLIDEVYNAARLNSALPAAEQENVVKRIYDEFSDDEIAERMAHMLTPPNINAGVKILFQTLEGLHNAVTTSPGDWYFSGNYPTPAGIRMINLAFIEYYERYRSVLYNPESRHK